MTRAHTHRQGAAARRDTTRGERASHGDEQEESRGLPGPVEGDASAEDPLPELENAADDTAEADVLDTPADDGDKKG